MKLLTAIITVILIIKKVSFCQLDLNSKINNITVRLNLIFEEKQSTKFSLWKKDSFFKGANVHPYKKFSPFIMREPIDENDLIELKKLGANLVVANFPGVFTYFPPYTIDSLHLKNLDRIVNLTANHNLYLVIALRSGPGRSLYSFFDKLREDEILFHDPVAKAKYFEMCEFITNRYKNFGHIVGINFLLEPHPDDPVAMNPIDDSSYFEFVDSLIQTVRKIDKEIPIIIQPMGWAYPDKFKTMKKFNDEKIIYSFDMYFPHSFTNEQNDSSYPGYFFVKDSLVFVDSEFLRVFLQPVLEFKEKHNVPVFVNEYGGIRYKKGLLNYLKDLHQIFKEHGFHFAYYVWKSEWLEIDGNSFDEFNYEKGLNKNEQFNTKDNKLLEEFIRIWKN